MLHRGSLGCGRSVANPPCCTGSSMYDPRYRVQEVSSYVRQLLYWNSQQCATGHQPHVPHDTSFAVLFTKHSEISCIVDS
jgi:hypothetical protein